MERRQWLQRTLASVVALVSAPASALMGAQEQSTGDGGGIAAFHRTKSEWRKLLTPEQYNVLFEEETERPYSSPLDKEKRSGTYVCAACHLPLFTSQTKYDSGDRLAELLRADRGARGDQARLLADRAENRIPLRALQRPPGSRVRRRPAADGTALVQQRRGAEVCPAGRAAATAQDLERFHNAVGTR